MAHGGEGEGGVPQAAPQDVPHTVRRQVPQAPYILHSAVVLGICQQCCGSGSVWIRNYFQDPDPTSSNFW